MANKKDPGITAAEAIHALEWHMEQSMLWKMKAITLLQMVGAPGVDQAKLYEECSEHAERGLTI